MGKKDTATAASTEDPLPAKENAVAVVDPAEARKRRKAIIDSQRMESDATEADEHSDSAAPSTETAAAAKKRKAEEKENKKKAQIRYDPEVPMNKDQLASWRREARRVRNRESAAASRAKIRSRITELEEEVDGWKDKYSQAIDRLQHLEEFALSQKASETATNT
jgi:bZIP transcription factor